jgi:hypothetical protein
VFSFSLAPQFLDDAGRLTRTQDGGDAARRGSATFGDRVSELRFTALGNGWRADWTIGTDDGVHRWRQTVGALATPLGAIAQDREAAP